MPLVRSEDLSIGGLESGKEQLVVLSCSSPEARSRRRLHPNKKRLLIRNLRKAAAPACVYHAKDPDAEPSMANRKKITSGGLYLGDHRETHARNLPREGGGGGGGKKEGF